MAEKEIVKKVVGRLVERVKGNGVGEGSEWLSDME